MSKEIDDLLGGKQARAFLRQVRKQQLADLRSRMKLLRLLSKKKVNYGH